MNTLAKKLVDNLNIQHHNISNNDNCFEDLYSVFFYNSLAVFEKRKVVTDFVLDSIENKNNI